MKKVNLVLIWLTEKREEQILCEYLLNAGYDFVRCANKKEFDDRLDSGEIIIIDLAIKEIDAILLCNEIKMQRQNDPPFIIIVADRPEDFTEITALDLGADDYILKPLKPQLLIKRLEALSRRKQRQSQKRRAHSGNFHIDPERHIVIVESKEYELPRKEFELLKLLHSVPNKIFSRQEISLLIWKDEKIAWHRTIDVHIRNIRKIIGEDLIKTVKGFGYGLNLTAEKA